MVHLVLNKEDFKKQLDAAAAANKLVLVDFFATWCGPCKVIAPKLEEFAATYVEKIVVLKVDVDECEDLAQEYDISSMPTFIFIKGEKVETKFSGANADKLEKTINELTK